MVHYQRMDRIDIRPYRPFLLCTGHHVLIQPYQGIIPYSHDPLGLYAVVFAYPFQFLLVHPVGVRKYPRLVGRNAVETGRWYQYALVYDGDSFRMYLDGELQDEETLSDEVKAGYAASSNPPVFQAIEFNSSWVTNYREGNEFHGRLWNVSVCPRALTQEQIAYCYRGMSDRGLQLLNWYGGAYWAFDDGTGYIVSQTAGTDMGDIDFSHTTRVDDESSGAYVDADVSQYVQWKADSLNDFSGE